MSQQRRSPLRMAPDLVDELIAERDRLRAALREATEQADGFQRVAEAVKAAKVQREPRHRVSMLVNDWARIEDALANVGRAP